MLVVSPGCSRHPAGSTKTHSRRRLRRAAAAGNCAARCWGWCGFPSDLRPVATGRPTRSRVPRAPRNGAGRRRGFYGAAHGGLSPPAAPETVLQGSQRTRGGEIAKGHDTPGSHACTCRIASTRFSGRFLSVEVQGDIYYGEFRGVARTRLRTHYLWSCDEAAQRGGQTRADGSGCGPSSCK